MDNYSCKSPVLLLIFNRPDTAHMVFNAIKAVKPPKLYIAADGPRKDRVNESELCKQARSIVEMIDWDCQVETLFRTENLGCKEAIASAVTWFFDKEEEGIVLEDDCLPGNDFFYYCDTLLEKYRTDERIRHISGCNLQFGKKWGDATVYFGNRPEVWGWASWKRVMKDYDKDLKLYHEDEVRVQMNKLFDDRFLIETWVQIFKDTKSGVINTWDYQLVFLMFFNNGLCVQPNINLVSNIGFRPDGTHTVTTEGKSANIPLEKITEITYPKYMIPERKADYELSYWEFHLDKQWKKYNAPHRKFKRWFKALFK